MCHCQNQVWANKVATTGGRSIFMNSPLRNSNLFVFCGLVGLSVQRWPHLTVLSVSPLKIMENLTCFLARPQKSVGGLNRVALHFSQCFKLYQSIDDQMPSKPNRRCDGGLLLVVHLATHMSTCVCFLPLLSVTKRRRATRYMGCDPGLKCHQHHHSTWSHHPISMEQIGETLSHFVGHRAFMVQPVQTLPVRAKPTTYFASDP